MKNKKLYSVSDAENLNITEIHNLYKKYISKSQVELIGSFGFGNDLVDYAEGSYIYLKNGKKIVDFTGGIGVLGHGHNHPRIIKERQLFQEKKRMEVHKNFFSPYMAALSHNFAEIMPGDLKYSYFPNSGSEAVEGAVKMAYKYHEGIRKSILVSNISFHGKLLGAASFTKSPELYFEFPQIQNVEEFEYNSLKSLEKLIENNTEKYFAVLLEPFSASSLLELSTEFLIATRKLCTKYDIVLIYDEVYTGWAKTGSLMNFMRSSEESNGYVSVSPDILTSAKTLGGGKASIAGYIASDKIFKKAYDNLKDATLHSTTYYGLGEESVTALEAINIVVEENHPELARSLGEKIHLRSEKLQNQFPELISDIRGKGLLHGIVLNADIKIIKKLIKLLPKSISSDEQFVDKLVTGSLISYLYDNFGLLTYYGSNQRIVFKIAPSTSISEDDIDYLFDALEQTLELGWIKILSSFVNRKVKSLIPIPN
jgi:putrescine aminotransferase